jgi:hypothetical protein
MKNFARNSCLFLLAAGLATGAVLAQTNTPSTSTSTNRPARAPRPVRYSGKIASLDTQAKSFILEGPAKDELLISSTTRITKAKQPATFEDLAVGQQVNGTKRMNASSNYVALTVVVGDPRPPVAP